MSSACQILLTPGPLSTSRRTKEAMLRDWGSWDTDFNRITGRIRESLLKVVHGSGTHECVPLQGSGTFAVEAAIGNLVPRDGHVLVPSNGAYCQRIARICQVIGRRYSVIDYPENAPVRAADVERRLAGDPSITHVALVHCETGTGLLNPLDEVAQAVGRQGRALIVDAMSSFGAIEIDLRRTPADAVVAASGKCIEGVPGMGFAIVRRTALEDCAGNAHSLALDLHEQWVYMQATTQWRYTPPTHVVAAFDEALRQFEAEGGQPARGARYSRNCDQLVGGMRALGFQAFLPRALQAPIIVTFHAPADPDYDFGRFYDEVKRRGYILYPGKLTQVDTFRIGCIGQVGEDGMRTAVAAVADALKTLGIRRIAAAA
jgi:2-aminoethylphosphonate-pyruvate transaminase